MTSNPVPARVLSAATMATGLVFVLVPRAVARRFSAEHRAPDSRIVQILGARQVVQGTAQMIAPKRGLLIAGAAVDILHLTSMLVAAAVWPAYRRPALSSAALTAVFAAAGLRISNLSSPRRLRR